MSCDIHLFTEKKIKIFNDEIWFNIDNWKLNPYYKEYNMYGETKYNVNPVCTDGGFALFSILADVKNYNNNKPISAPKGLPSDVSEIVKLESYMLSNDSHSHSFLTMKEIYDYYEQNNIIKFSGFVDEFNSKKIDNGEMPDVFCHGTNKENLIWKEWTRENFIIKNLIDALEKHFESEHYRKKYDSEKFRIVFWFVN